MANAISQSVTVNIPAGTYTLTLGALHATDPAGVQLVGAGASTTTITARAPRAPRRLRGDRQRRVRRPHQPHRERRRAASEVEQQNAVLIMNGATVPNASGTRQRLGRAPTTDSSGRPNTMFADNTSIDGRRRVFNNNAVRRA